MLAVPLGASTFPNVMPLKDGSVRLTLPVLDVTVPTTKSYERSKMFTTPSALALESNGVASSNWKLSVPRVPVVAVKVTLPALMFATAPGCVGGKALRTESVAEIKAASGVDTVPRLTSPALALRTTLPAVEVMVPTFIEPVVSFRLTPSPAVALTFPPVRSMFTGTFPEPIEPLEAFRLMPSA